MISCIPIIFVDQKTYQFGWARRPSMLLVCGPSKAAVYGLPSCYRSAIIKPHLQGVSAREIHQCFGVHRSVIYRTIKRYRELGTDPEEEGVPPSLPRKEVKKERSRVLFRRLRNRRIKGMRMRDLFTEEKLFTVEQVINKQNDHVYVVSNPHATAGRSSHPASVMVFAGITACKTPPWFVPDGTKEDRQNCLDILKDKLLPWANSHFGNFCTFQRDGAPATQFDYGATMVQRKPSRRNRL
ncbi:unnamed protein product [Haemonchus placei]|uniref:Helix-turn-helix domain-containing protein n=1 Tax=Haemonchus placei TaxID=6290 RepID=A0A0N4W594_HAEPC|nr:unnamed protein product [Haemonchus placei]